MCYNILMKAFFYFILFILFIGLLVAGYIGSIVFMKDLRSGRAETMSGHYVANLFSEYKIIGINCQGEDTNADSYVSCDVRIQKGDDVATEKILNLACPTMWKSYTGNTCKERLLGVSSE
jgi:flagellar basal body-associated protein FliL